MKYIKSFDTISEQDTYKNESDYNGVYLGYTKEDDKFAFGLDNVPFFGKLFRADGTHVSVQNKLDIASLEDKDSFVKGIFTNFQLDANTKLPNLEEVKFVRFDTKNTRTISISIPDTNKIKVLDLRRVRVKDVAFLVRFRLNIAIKNQDFIEEIILPDNWVYPNSSNAQFQQCPNLKKITIGRNCDLSNKTNYSIFNSSSIEKFVFEGTSVPFKYRLQNSGNPSLDVNIPQTFLSDCENLKSITLPTNLVGIGTNAFYNTAYRIFTPSKCKNIGLNIGLFETVHIPSDTEYMALNPFNVTGNTIITVMYNNKNFTSGENNYSEGTLDNCIIDKKRNYLVKACINSNIAAPSVDIYTIDRYAIYQDTIKTVVLPSTIKQININGFYKCPNLHTIFLPAIVPPILSSDGIVNCPNIEHIYVPAQSVETYKTATNWVNYADKISAIVTTEFKADDDSLLGTINSNIITTSDIALFKTNIKSIKASIGQVPMLTTIQAETFKNCNKIQNIQFDFTTFIGHNAFENCSALTEVKLVNIRQIENAAFNNCSNLQRVSINSEIPPLIRRDFKGNIVNTQDIFMNCPESIQICVPNQSVDLYKEDEGWSKYADKIVGVDFTE